MTADGDRSAGWIERRASEDASACHWVVLPLAPDLPGRGFDHGVNNVVGIATTPTKRGEWIILGNGGAFAFGAAGSVKRPARFRGPIQAVFSNPERQGYALVPFGAAPAESRRGGCLRRKRGRRVRAHIAKVGRVESDPRPLRRPRQLRNILSMLLRGPRR